MLRRTLKRNKEYRQTKRNLLTKLFVFVTIASLVIYGIVFTLSLFEEGAAQDDVHSETSRKLLGRTKPEEALNKKQRLQGGLILYLMGVFYMFLAIAVVCDEFFVPCIEVIVDKLHMTPDTAGATFMAAGGSAPELFTSFIGTFITQDDVGFGTIVGSAVFNVLFVIGCCAIFSTGDLVLTWWPFFRDCTYYSLSLLTLAIFFGMPPTQNKIMWYEAMVLLMMYIGYVTLMMNNEKIWKYVQKQVLHRQEKRKHKFRKTNPETGEDIEVEEIEEDISQIRVTRPLQFTVSIFDLMTGDAELKDLAGIHMVTRIKGDVRATFRAIDENGDGEIDTEEFRKCLRRLGRHISDEEAKECFDEIDENKNGKIEYEEFNKWYVRSTWKLKQDIETVFRRFDADDNGYIDADELYELLKALNTEPPSTEDVENARKILDKDDDHKITLDEFMHWYEHTVFFQNERARRATIAEAEEDEEEGIKLELPHNFWGRLNFILSLPIIVPLFFTVPNVRVEKWKNWYPLGVVTSITWLGVYSYLMVWWAVIFGETVGIPPAVMGLTILAAGTSVPDLLTSIIVAKHGEGDMAVSSSIGSNIFDVLIGLPLPWLSYCIIYGRGITVEATNLFISILVLFAMVFCVLMIIIWQKWRMTRMLGYFMFALYGVFVLQDLLRVYL